MRGLLERTGLERTLAAWVREAGGCRVRSTTSSPDTPSIVNTACTLHRIVYHLFYCGPHRKYGDSRVAAFRPEHSELES